MNLSLFTRVSISKKIALVMSGVILVIAVLALVSGYALSSTVSTFSLLIENESAMMHHAHIAKIDLLRIRSQEKNALYNDDQSLVKSINSLTKRVAKEVNIVGSLVENTNDSVMIDTVKNLIKNVDNYNNYFKKAAAAPVGQARMRAAIPMRKTANKTEKNLDSFLEQVDKRIQNVKADTLKHSSKMKTIVMVTGLAGALFGIIFAVLLSLSIVRPLRKIQDRMTTLAQGSFEEEIPFLTRGDEIGLMAKSVQVFRDNGVDAEKMRTNQEEAKKRAEVEKRKAMNELAESFDSQIGGLINSLTSASTELQSTAESMRSIADETAQSSATVATSSEEASSNVSTVASAMEEMSASAGEISTQIVTARTKSNDTASNAESANETVSNLNELVGNIGEVVEAIQDIAEQTNLLALNATIEAARAGEAGKGFAVVADEVKKLATETAQKTGEINERINEIQGATHSSVTAMQRIISNISEIDESVTGVSAAVEEQNATTSEILRSVAEASQSVQQVSQIITDVQKGAGKTGASADDVLMAAKEVSTLSENLKGSVDKFLNEIRNDNS